jgi:acetylglutamate kinase
VDNFLEGEPTIVNPDILVALEETDIIPIVASLGTNEKYELFYVCPLACGAMISSALVADKLIIYTDGTLTLDGEIIHELTITEANKLIEQKKIDATHIPALNACIQAVSQHTCEAYIINATLPSSLVLELFGSNTTGTCIVYE